MRAAHAECERTCSTTQEMLAAEAPEQDGDPANAAIESLVSASTKSSQAVEGPVAVDGDHVLGLSASEVDGLLRQFGESGGRALLALIYRLSSIESELAALRMLMERGGAANVVVGGAAPGWNLPDAQATGQSARGGRQADMLKQVFQSNLALWKSMK